MRKTLLLIFSLSLAINSWAVKVTYTKNVNAIVIYRFFKADKQRNLYMLFSANLYLNSKLYPVGNSGCLTNYNYVKYNKRKCKCINELYNQKNVPIISSKYFGNTIRYDTVDLIQHTGGQLFSKIDDTADSAFYVAYKVRGQFAIVDDSFQECIYPLLCSPSGSYKDAQMLPAFALNIKEFAPLNQEDMKGLNLKHKTTFDFMYFISD